MIIIAASQFQCWLLFYSGPVLKGIMNQDIFEHYLLLVAGMHILTSDSISQSQLELAETFLNQFYLQYSDLYGK